MHAFIHPTLPKGCLCSRCWVEININKTHLPFSRNDVPKLPSSKVFPQGRKPLSPSLTHHFFQPQWTLEASSPHCLGSPLLLQRPWFSRSARAPTICIFTITSRNSYLRKPQITLWGQCRRANRGGRTGAPPSWPFLGAYLGQREKTSSHLRDRTGWKEECHDCIQPNLETIGVTSKARYAAMLECCWASRVWVGRAARKYHLHTTNITVCYYGWCCSVPVPCHVIMVSWFSAPQS